MLMMSTRPAKPSSAITVSRPIRKPMVRFLLAGGGGSCEAVATAGRGCGGSAALEVRRRRCRPGCGG